MGSMVDACWCSTMSGKTISTVSYQQESSIANGMVIGIQFAFKYLYNWCLAGRDLTWILQIEVRILSNMLFLTQTQLGKWADKKC